jgi:hypothetical protein
MGGNGCNANEHYATTGGHREGADHTDCIQLTCDEVHAVCGEPVPTTELDALERAASTGDRTTVESILVAHRSLTVNSERSALQELDCAGDVVAHIPVPSMLIPDLSAAAQNRR